MLTSGHNDLLNSALGLWALANFMNQAHSAAIDDNVMFEEAEMMLKNKDYDFSWVVPKPKPILNHFKTKNKNIAKPWTNPEAQFVTCMATRLSLESKDVFELIRTGLKFPDFPKGTYTEDEKTGKLMFTHDLLSLARLGMEIIVNPDLYKASFSSHNGIHSVWHAMSYDPKLTKNDIRNEIISDVLVCLKLAVQNDAVVGSAFGKPDFVWLGRALHTISDSYSPAHVVRHPRKHEQIANKELSKSTVAYIQLMRDLRSFDFDNMRDRVKQRTDARKKFQHAANITDFSKYVYDEETNTYVLPRGGGSTRDELMDYAHNVCSIFNNKNDAKCDPDVVVELLSTFSMFNTHMKEVQGMLKDEQHPLSTRSILLNKLHEDTFTPYVVAFENYASQEKSQHSKLDKMDSVRSYGMFGHCVLNMTTILWFFNLALRDSFTMERYMNVCNQYMNLQTFKFQDD
jgi:hypothetical protein